MTGIGSSTGLELARTDRIQEWPAATRLDDFVAVDSNDIGQFW